MSLTPVNLDALSGQPLHPAAREVLDSALARGYADPRRLHRAGRDARLLWDNARAAAAEALSVSPDEVTFMPSGTHAVHSGLLGLVRGGRGKRRVAYSAVEHSAVRHAIDWGADGIEVAVDRTARVLTDDLNAACSHPDLAAVAVQTANHEVGTLQDLDGAELPTGLPVFTDACASMGRVPLPSWWTVAAGSAHKWGGPAGVGILLVRRRAPWRNPFPGDDRIDERAAGFENIASALAAAAALQAVVAERAEVSRRQFTLVDLIRRRVAAEIPDVEVVGDPRQRLPHVVTFSCLYVDGEALVSELDRAGFGVASGSACAASTLTPSHVLASMGVLTHGNVRVSLQRDTTPEQVNAFCDALPPIVRELRHRVGV